MEKNSEEVPLNQIVYQPTTISDKTNLELNKQKKSKVWFVYAAAITGKVPSAPKNNHLIIITLYSRSFGIYFWNIIFLDISSPPKT